MKKIIILFSLVFLFFGSQAGAFTPLTLVSFEVSETSISPNGDGIQDTVNIDIEYSEEVKADINILDSNGDKVRDLYNSNKVTNPQNKIWDGKDNFNQIVPGGLYTIEILGIAVADETNIIFDTSKNIYVEFEEETESQPETLSISTEVDVPSSCEVLDTDNVTHTYATSSTDSYLGICALKAALDLGDISSVKLSNQYPSMGLFVTSFNGIEADSSSQYWALYQDDVFASSGISTLPIYSGDIILFKLSDFAGVETGDYVNITIRSLIKDTEFEEETESQPESSGGSSISSRSGSLSTTKKIFSVPEALYFLSSNQNLDGSFSSSMYTDWIAVAVKAVNDSSLRLSISDYLKLNPLNSSTITENERRAMALMALNINPYDGTEINYIKKIIDSFDGEQIGDTSLYNDDIFGLIVLQNAGYVKDDAIISKIISYILSKQSSNGSWGSVDMTGAGIMALKDFEDVNGVSNAISDAENYLLESQTESDGGFGNSFATSWAVQALSLNNSYNFEVKNAIEYLANEQQNDGGLGGGDTNTRLWATAYALPAVLGLSWNDILVEFSKPVLNSSISSINIDEEGNTKNEEGLSEEDKKNEEEELNQAILLTPVISFSEKIKKIEPTKEFQEKTIFEKTLDQEIKNYQEKNTESSLLASASLAVEEKQIFSSGSLFWLASLLGIIVLGVFVFRSKF